MKTCTKCRISKSLAEFYFLPSRNGYQARCKACTKASVIAWNKANPELAYAREMRYRRSHRKQYAKTAAAWYLKNKKRNHDNAAAWYQKNPHKGAAKRAKYRASQFLATPKWINEFFVSEAYALARLRTKVLGYPWHVDHIVPLKSEIVCGLHWEKNLQVIPGSRNSEKGNRFWPDMPSQP